MTIHALDDKEFLARLPQRIVEARRGVPLFVVAIIKPQMNAYEY